MLKLFCSLNELTAVVEVAVSESKKTVSAVAAAVVGIGLLFAPSAVGQERPPAEPHPGESRSLLSPEVYSIEVHNHASAGFSISLSISSGWEAFDGAYLCEPNGFCRITSPFSSRTFRWPAPVYLANPPRGTSTHSYDFELRPKSPVGWVEGRPFGSAGLEIDVTVYIEVTNGVVSSIYCYVDYPSSYLGPFRRSDWYPPLLYQGRWYSY